MKKQATFLSLCALIALASAVYFFSGQVIDNHEEKKSRSIGLLVMATGNYIRFVPQLLHSADRFFCPGHTVTYFVFTDGDTKEITCARPLVTLYQERLGWPYDSMMRFHVYHRYKESFSSMDYLFSCDADMTFQDYVGDEILGDRVAVIHPQLRFSRGIYETNPLSTACVHRTEERQYVVGGFYGGSTNEFCKLLATLKTNIDIDFMRCYVAKVHDESHLNRYFIDNPPTVLLPPWYCHFESWNSPYPKKLVAFDADDHNKGSLRTRPVFDAVSYYKRFVWQQNATTH